MKLNNKEIGFLWYFLPLFVTKLLNITADNIILKLVAVVCFIIFLFQFVRRSTPIRLFQIYLLLGLYSTLLIFASGKQGVFFSVVTLIAMRGISLERAVYKFCFYIGVIFLLWSCYLEREGVEALRNINGEWVYMVKRSNILFISFLAVLNIYLLLHKKKMNLKTFTVAIFFSYILAMYSGSRTGVIIVILLFLQIFLFKFKIIKNNKIIKYLCVLSPFICCLISYACAYYYGKNELLYFLDDNLQGRIYQGANFLTKYGVSVFGQHIEENFDSSNFACLDSAYLDMLISLGFIFTLFWIVITSKVIYFMYNKNRMLEVAMLTSYAIYGITETFLINCFLNISIFFYGEYLYSKYDKNNYKVNHIVKRNFQ